MKTLNKICLNLYRSKRVLILISFVSILTNLTAITAFGQSGNQSLDGVGETALSVRYIFDNDVRDWSRNNLHAKVLRDGISFVNDNQFGKVLSLSGKEGAAIGIPSESLNDTKSITIMGWVNMLSDTPNQYVLAIGEGTNGSFGILPTGSDHQKGFLIRMNTNNGNLDIQSSEIKLNEWVHFAVVIDDSSTSIGLFINGKQKKQDTANGSLSSQILREYARAQDFFYLGRPLDSNTPYLQGKLHDFRIYRVALSPTDISRIYHNAKGDKISPRENRFSNKRDTVAPFYAEYLMEIPDIKVKTTVGSLPRLPRYLKGKYQEGHQGPKVRVLWPAPTQVPNQAKKPGQYTIIGRVPGTDFKPKAIVEVKEAIAQSDTPSRSLESFGLDKILLKPNSKGLDTKFMENRSKFVDTLAHTNPDSFLYMFRNAFGQPQPEKAKPLGVWDSQETKLRGHATGHYLSALAQAYSGAVEDSVRQNIFKSKMNYMIDVLYDLSQKSGRPMEPNGQYVSDPTKVPPAENRTSYDSDLSEEGIRTDYWNWGKGYISAYPPDQFIMLEGGATYGTRDDQVWAPYYTLHKIMAGLLDVYEATGNKKALSIATGMADWVYARLSQLSEKTLIEMWNSYIAGEYGGMNEVMARLSRITNTEQYLKGAHFFDNVELFFGNAEHTGGLGKNVDSFRGKHANQHIPQIVGALEVFRDANDAEYYQVASNFWYKATHDYMYSIGGVAGAKNPVNAERFTAEPATLFENGFSKDGQNETCATYNMLKLSRDLFLYKQNSEYMDYYERALYNHILASVAEDSPANTYHVPLNTSSSKSFSNGNMTGFTCCNGTALESNTRLQDVIYIKSIDDQSLYVNLYIPSVLNWSERNIIIEQSTDFPYEDKTKLIIKKGGAFTLNVRVPHWAQNGFIVKINGRDQKVNAAPGTYIGIDRVWKDGDTIDIQMPFDFYLESVMDQPNIASLFYGPVLLAAQEKEPRKEWHKLSLNEKDISQSIQGDASRLRFTVDGVQLKPFFDSYQRYSVYFDVSLD